MKPLFAPGVALMGRLSNQKKLPLISALFILPFGILYYETYSQLSVAQNVVVWVALGVALYAMTSFYFQAGTAWAQLFSLTRRVAQGDLTARLETKLSGQFGLMMDALTELTRSLGQVVSQVRASSHAVAHSATEIAAGNSNLSQCTEQQASTLEETASATEQLTSTVRQNAEGCRRASVLAKDARKIAGEAADSMRRMAGTMDRIEDGSKRVAEITYLIESIAFQTNILALNAAVEAANAGEHGRGFAVVASEVRSLAGRCSGAAKEIRGVIAESAQAVGDGGKLADEAGATIDRVVTSVTEVSEVIGEIARGSAEQSAGADGIAKAIQHLDGMTQSNAALVEESGVAARSFEEQVRRLMDAVSLFKLERSEARDAAMEMPIEGSKRLPRPVA